MHRFIYRSNKKKYYKYKAFYLIRFLIIFHLVSHKNKEDKIDLSIKDRKGFTAIELLMVIAVMGIFSAVVIFDHRDFQDRLELSNDAQMVVLNFREVRATALSVREAMEGGFEDRFRRGRGLYFNTDQENSSSFVYFIDLDGGGKYSYPSSTTGCDNDECIRTVSLHEGNRVSDICMWFEGGVEECGFDSVEIFFKRPSTDTEIIFDSGSDSSDHIGAVIKLQSPQGIEKDVLIEDTGIALVR